MEVIQAHSSRKVHGDHDRGVSLSGVSIRLALRLACLADVERAILLHIEVNLSVATCFSWNDAVEDSLVDWSLKIGSH